MRCLKIWWHKRQARRYILAINALTQSYSCGIDMINVITGGDYNRLVTLRNKHVMWLRENDPKYPQSK